VYEIDGPEGHWHEIPLSEVASKVLHAHGLDPTNGFAGRCIVDFKVYLLCFWGYYPLSRLGFVTPGPTFRNNR